LDQAIRCLPDLPASLPILGRTPQTSRRFQTESRGPPLEPIRPPLVPTLQQQRTSPDAGEESMSIAARIVRPDLGGVVRAYRSARRQPRGTEVARPRRRTHCGRLWGAYCCCNQCPEPEVRVLTCRECWRTSDRTTRPL
jgi:hypothetical protein